MDCTYIWAQVMDIDMQNGLMHSLLAKPCIFVTPGCCMNVVPTKGNGSQMKWICGYYFCVKRKFYT